jgi:hypothetical protein
MLALACPFLRFFLSPAIIGVRYLCIYNLFVYFGNVNNDVDIGIKNINSEGGKDLDNNTGDINAEVQRQR